MTLEEIYWIGQTIAAVAVVVSLFYLALQTRQVARGQRSAMHQARSHAIADDMLHLSQADMAAVLAKASRGDALSEEEFTQFSAFMMAVFHNIEEQHRQYREGLLDETRWRATLDNMRLNLRSPAFRAMWRLLSKRTGKEFAAVIDEVIAGARRETQLTLSDMWRTFDAEERRLQPLDFVTAKPDVRAD